MYYYYYGIPKYTRLVERIILEIRVIVNFEVSMCSGEKYSLKFREILS